ncbi:MAG: 50S ribosomal protein L24 [archaeon]
MKKKFSTKWKSSKLKRKQRKYKANISKHLKKAFLSSNLSKELRKKYSRRSFPLRKGDTVKVLRGKFKNKSGKVSGVNRSKMRVSIENIQAQKKDGTKVNVWFSPSKIQIQELNLEDKKREQAISRNMEDKNALKKK